ncbi:MULTISPECIES: dynamin family protein [Bacillus cereus group]|uniref:dynamin family protein n=1 Tax=Bacillus cereus group TaxID=86661 RepID=UPI001298CDC1|nr:MULTISPECIES: dynamin family protein [Bacillus cereus group]MCR6788358.1 dynamin family protein [Bacillus thuringiensis]MCR6821956.1 dynamin family protein [Bacillus thuringiensis]MCR6830434.1 dynamin family protein [Bacillus thuringiensis]MEB8928895.1 dynamin family protein [Bacillus cereus]MEB9327664.1 dynamin family protein [Bacillus cereus]
MTNIVQTNGMKKLVCFYEEWQKHGDAENSLKLFEVIQKYKQEQLMIAFCGHFSAGKSTMMNHLYKAQLLPTSPIPTSANVVKIEKGMDRVVVTVKSGEQYEYDGAYSAEELKQICKDGDEVIGVHIYRNDAPIPEGVMLVDTPGIDSTDDAHQLATESTLHLADVIFYMMDYNHVQSEVNLQFVKELKQRNKTVYLVVNQIDKHKENELSFENYKDSVKQSFSNWDIEVDGVYYTSLRMMNHPHNEIGSLETLITSIMKEKEQYVRTGMERETEYLMGEHFSFIVSENEKALLKYEEELASPLSISEVVEKKEELTEAKNREASKESHVRNEFIKGLQAILDNAYLMPFEMRELANAYLETKLTKFKVGLLFAKGKTEQEKQRRVEAFYSALQKTVETQLDFHVKEFIVAFLKEEGLFTEEIGKDIYGLEIAFGPEMLAEVIKQGAGFTGDYLLLYTADVANELKKRYFIKAQQIFDKSAVVLKQKVREAVARIEEEIETYTMLQTAKETQLQYNNNLVAYEDYLRNVWHDHIATPEGLQIDEILQREKQIVSEKFTLQEQEIVNDNVAIHEEELKGTAALNIQRILEKVKKAETILEPLPALKHVQQEVIEKRRRVETKQFTVALFGAFSAGKSSFANALLGEKVLPVSPNPTTATINQILPVTEEKPHGTVIVQFKSKQALLEDMKAVYKLFHYEIATLDEALAQIDNVMKYPSPTGKQKTTFSFLRAVQKGYDAVSTYLGEQVQVTLEEFSDYVANEEKSCFVEYMELYYDCALTRQGVALVDTPGADSINARHTDVAFQYIKNADAILFVTYYNHVFSRADREFLIQLGRVKDTFALDKMFFLINAADLAESEEELEMVKGYIADQLLQYGIRNPRLFAISSLCALEEKQGKNVEKEKYGILQNSGITKFEESFTSFMMRDLMLVSVHALYGALQGADQLLVNMIKGAKQGNEEKEKQTKKYEAERDQLLHIISSYSVLAEEQAMQNEVKELLYYVQQRLFLRYNDVFTEFINPASLRTDGNVKTQLQQCVMELVAFIQHDLLQEMRATSLRLEKWIDEAMKRAKDEIVVNCKVENESISMNGTVEYEYKDITHKEPFPSVEIKDFKKALAHFKNEKSFFEKNDKAFMQEDTKSVLEPLVSNYVADEKDLFVHHYKQEWDMKWNLFQKVMQQDVMNYYESILFALDETIDVSLYEQSKEQLQKQLVQIEKEIYVI